MTEAVQLGRPEATAARVKRQARVSQHAGSPPHRRARRACCSLTGVGAAASACTAMNSGPRRLRRARSATRRVCVALNSSVWRPRGRFSRMAFTVAAKPWRPRAQRVAHLS